MNNDRYSDDNKVHDTQRLKELQALPLERKVLITQSRILDGIIIGMDKCMFRFRVVRTVQFFCIL